MAHYDNFETKNKKYERDRYDIYEPAFETPLQRSVQGATFIDRHIKELAEGCSYLRFYADIFWDMYKPETGGLTFDLYQRVMLRVLTRFHDDYLCSPRGSAKTLVHVMHKYHTAVCYPGIQLSITASTKEQAVKIWQDKHNEIKKFYPSFMENIVSANFSKDTARVEFINGSVITNLANSQQSKGFRRHRGGLEEANLIDKDTYDDCIEPIFNIGRVTMTGVTDPMELNGQIHRYSTSGKKVA